MVTFESRASSIMIISHSRDCCKKDFARMCCCVTVRSWMFETYLLAIKYWYEGLRPNGLAFRCQTRRTTYKSAKIAMILRAEDTVLIVKRQFDRLFPDAFGA